MSPVSSRCSIRAQASHDGVEPSDRRSERRVQSRWTGDRLVSLFQFSSEAFFHDGALTREDDFPSLLQTFLGDEVVDLTFPARDLVASGYVAWEAVRSDARLHDESSVESLDYRPPGRS